jgi:NTP pyrophosphatase (non-canonical NTP hydrolase)
MMNDINEAQRERLIKLMEECAEVIHISAKILIYGYDEVNVKKPNGPTNKVRLEKEIGDVVFWTGMLALHNDINLAVSEKHSEKKIDKAMKYTQHQEGSKWNNGS